jgi:hypothetical protein
MLPAIVQTFTRVLIYVEVSDAVIPFDLRKAAYDTPGRCPGAQASDHRGSISGEILKEVKKKGEVVRSSGPSPRNRTADRIRSNALERSASTKG